MQSKNIDYIVKLDHLRFLAAFLVLEFHTEIWLRGKATPPELLPLALFHQGYVGVSLFMVISGMILSMIAYEKKIDTLRFYLNRALRIYPLFIAAIAFSYFTTPDPRGVGTGLEFLLSLLPVSNLYRMNYGPYGGVLFSVAIEMQFYLLFPLLLLQLRKHGMFRYGIPLIGFLLVLRSAVFYLTGVVHQFSYFSIFGALDLFFIGMVAGDIYMRYPKLRFPFWFPLVGFYLLNLLVSKMHTGTRLFNFDWSNSFPNAVSPSPLWIVWPTMQGLAFAVFALVYVRSTLWVPFSGVIAYLGKISFSLYVWHTMVCLAMLKYGYYSLSPYLMGLLIVLPISVVLASFSYYLIEHPFLSLRVKYATTPELSVERGK